MKFSKLKIIVFFSAVIIFIWFLYPREVFMGFIYEGEAQFELSEKYYQNYLKDHPHNKFVTLRLAKLYSRMGLPHRATPMIEELYQHRPRDWKVAEFYLSHLEDLHDDEGLFVLRKRIANNFLKAPSFSRGRVRQLLEDALSYAIWNQRIEDVESLIAQLITLSSDPEDYLFLRADYDRGLRRVDRVVQFLTERLAVEPGEMDTRIELAQVHFLKGEKKKAFQLIEEGLKQNPMALELLETKMLLFLQDKNEEAAIEVVKTILSLPGLSSERRADFYEKLAFVYSKKGMLEEVEKIYREGMHREDFKSKDRRFFLSRLDAFYRDQKKWDKVVSLYEEALRSDFLKRKDRIDYWERLASLYLQRREKDKALAAYQEVLKLDRKTKDPWFNLIFFYERFGEFEKMILTLQDYLKEFTGDKEGHRLLAEVYLYKMEDISQLPLYYDYVLHNHEEKLAMGVADLLLKKKRNKEAQRWVRQVYPLFPRNTDLLEILVASYVDEGRFEEILKRMLFLHQQRPKEPFFLLKMAQLYYLMQKPAESKATYAQLESLLIKDGEILTRIGKDILFAGNSGMSLGYLEKGVALRPKDPESVFWLSEALYSQGFGNKAKGKADLVVELLKDKKGLNEEENRIQIKSKARLKISKDIEEEYQKYFKRYPNNLDFRTDLMDVYLETGKWQSARRLVEPLKRKYSEEGERWRPYEIRIAFAAKEWERAIILLKEVLNKRPYLWSYQRDLAEAYEKSGYWEEARKTYQEVFKATQNDLKVLEPLKRMAAIYDDRLSFRFSLTDFGADDFFEGESQFQAFLKRDWEFRGKVLEGRYKAVSDGFSAHAQKGDFRIRKHFFQHDWVVEGGGGFGNSPRRTTPSFLLAAFYEQPAAYGFSFGGEYRLLRADFPEAVSDGVLQDKVWQASHFYIGDRLYLFEKYEFVRDYLPNGAKAFEHFLEPGFSFQVVQRPEIAFGYHFTFQEIDQKNNFFNFVSLIHRMRTHVLSVQWVQRLGNDFVFQTSLFAGEDTARNIDMLDGDLYGVNAAIDWDFCSWLDLKSRYTFGKESLSNVTGTSHQISVAISGHWH